MGAHGGPNMVEDGMVFGYDTGNSKSYAGEPTTNLHPNPEDVSSWTGDLFGNWTRSTVTSNVSIAPDGTLTADRIGDGYGRFNSSITAIPGQTYVYTVYLKNVSLTNNFGIAVAWGLNGSLVSYNGSATTVQISQISNTEWTRVTATEVAPSSGINQVQFGPCPFTGYGNPSGQTIDVWGGMIEQKSHATPYTTGTRSATEGLIDFKDSTTLDLSNVSFDSDAQPRFDGADDYISLADGTKWFTNEWAYELVVKFTGSSSNWQGLVWGEGATQAGYSGLQKLFLYRNTEFQHRVYNTVSGWGSIVYAPTNFDPTQYNHLVWQWNNGTTNIAINGEIVHTHTGRGAYNGGTDSPLFIGARNDLAYDLNGEIPYLKRYSRVLTAEEVQNNFNGIRNRFGI